MNILSHETVLCQAKKFKKLKNIQKWRPKTPFENDFEDGF
jgi:hypothetical protein